MAPKKIVVFGITGVQGGSVARYLLDDGPEKFEVWGVTRSKTSAKAKALEQQGIKLIEGDLDKPESYEAGLAGADNVWVNADFWLYYDGHNADVAGAREVAQNKGVIDAARRQKVPHITFSALANFGDKFPVPHCDSKVKIVEYLKDIGQNHALVYPAWYFTNVLIFPRRREGDKWIVQWPFPDDKKMTGFAPEQVGAFARLVFRDPEAWNGKEIHCVCDIGSPLEQAAAIFEHLGVTVEVEHLTRERFFSPEFKATLPDELFINYKAILDGIEDPETDTAHALYPGAWYFKDWVANTPALATTFTK
ncbi:NmrA-like family domain-containing protein 1 [Vanrija pseudolonga]|uniref:NmrA-like family domain-containing protein 1 n=1 Tax=Vanrija pseudolonga TaxID=143232 RepID=A0AAF0YHM9_9TREE|nr:NmrA-like family domain-containing protein 1 [Vanrija pseudolonga]